MWSNLKPDIALQCVSTNVQMMQSNVTASPYSYIDIGDDAKFGHQHHDVAKMLPFSGLQNFLYKILDKILYNIFSINSLDFCSNGQYVFIGDQNGGLGMFKTDSNLSNLSKIRRFLICPNSKISNISVRQVSKCMIFKTLIG